MGNGRIDHRVYMGECMGSHSVGRPRKRGIDSLSSAFKVWMLYKQGERCMIGVNGMGF